MKLEQIINKEVLVKEVKYEGLRLRICSKNKDMILKTYNILLEKGFDIEKCFFHKSNENYEIHKVDGKLSSFQEGNVQGNIFCYGRMSIRKIVAFLSNDKDVMLDFHFTIFPEAKDYVSENDLIDYMKNILS